MAFDNHQQHVTQTHIYPTLSDMIDADEDEVLQHVKQLSLITAQQDEQRRASRASQQYQHCSRVSLQESNSLPELIGPCYNETSSRATTDTQIARPRPFVGSTEFSTLPRSNIPKPSIAPPLPAVGPNASLNKVDITRIPSPPHSTQRASTQSNRPDIPPRPQPSSTARSQSVSPPFHRHNLLTPYSGATDEPASSSSLDLPLISLSPPCNRSDFDLSALDPYRPSRPTSHHLSDTFCGSSKTRASPIDTLLQRDASTVGSLLQFGNSAPSASTQYQRTPVAPNIQWMVAAPSNQRTSVAASNQWAVSAPSNQWTPVNNSNQWAITSNQWPPVVHSNQWASQWAGTVASVPQSVYGPGPCSQWVGTGSVTATHMWPTDSLHSSASSSVTDFTSDEGIPPWPSMGSAARDRTSEGSSIETTDMSPLDLMDFSSDSRLDPLYLSLTDFDPLFAVDSPSLVTESNFDSNELFLPSLQVITSGVSPSPVPTGVSSQQLHKVMSATTLQQQQQQQLITADQSVSIASSNTDELQDPFSYQDLTMSLEKKRQQHAKEQEKRELNKPQENKSAVLPVNKTQCVSCKRKGFSSYEMLQDFSDTADDEIRAFLQMVSRIKCQFPADDISTNRGVVVSPRTTHVPYYKLTVKVVVFGSFITENVVFTCDGNTLVSHVITHVLLALSDDVACANLFVLKVYGCSEYLLNDTALCDYEYVQQCLNLDRDIQFVIVDAETVLKPFLRTVEDEKFPVFVPRSKHLSSNPALHVTKDRLNILMETFYKEVEKFRDAVMQGSVDGMSHFQAVVQIVNAICTVLHNIETIDLIKAMRKLKFLVTHGQTDDYKRRSSDCREILHISVDDLHNCLEDVTRSVKALIDMYCRAFHTEFRFLSSIHTTRETCSVMNLRECLIVHIGSVHRLPAAWKNTYCEFTVVCYICHGTRKVGRDVKSQPQQMITTDGLHGSVSWDNWLSFETVLMGSLPRESRLCFTLVGVRVINATNNEGQQHRVNVPLCWVSMQLYNQQFELVQGRHLLCLWPGKMTSQHGTNIGNTESHNSLLLQVDFPDFDCNYIFPSIPEPLPSAKQDFKSLHPDDQEFLQAVIEKDALTRLSEEESDYLWEKRNYLYDHPSALPRVIQTVNSWSWNSLREVYTMIQEWKSMPPLESLQLLLPHYPDTYVRNKAVDQLKELPADDLYDLLPQLVQALKFECYHTSALARMLLEKSAVNVRIAHHFYWLLKEAADDIQYRKRFQLLFGALLSVVGHSMRCELAKQDEFVHMLSAIADKVKAAKDKEAVLQRELSIMWEFFNHPSVRLPLNPSQEVVGIDGKSCSYFTSFTCPLKLALKNSDSLAGNIDIMFKAGDDLRQDMLTLQLIHIMDKLWLQEGLDLKMVTFRCQPTGAKRGLVELVVESETLRKIQVKSHGLAGSFKDRTIAEWLQVQNPTELNYQKAVDNFTLSCAGYCVATYVLGICDRHNDNIMIKHSGHIFHIDFAKFLGDAQMFGNIKRDRTPFVLTSDMAYVINGGDKPSERFQHFVDLCCRAFNILRKNANLFINLFSLMTLSGIPGVTADAPKYIQKSLLPDRTDAEAIAELTRMINVCLQSIFTQVNFFIHNLAQMKFSGHDESSLLSFVPKTYTLQTDGRITLLELHGIQKRYSPEKHYVYIVRVERECQRVASYILRRYSEFQELHRKLVMTFPLVRLPSLSGRVILGRAHVRTVAETRKTELDLLLKQLLHLASEVAQHDLIYTFFHPLLRDEQDFDKNKLKNLPTASQQQQQQQQQQRRIDGCIKLNLFYKNDTLTVMVMHVKDLGPMSNGEAPNPYVKLYLLPDPLKSTKRKTKIAKNSFNPTYNEMLMYRLSADELRRRTLQAMVWSYDSLKENEFLGAVHVSLATIDWTQTDNTAWHRLQTLHVIPNITT